MRLLSVITAIVISLVLYAWVFERDLVRDFAQRGLPAIVDRLSGEGEGDDETISAPAATEAPSPAEDTVTAAEAAPAGPTAEAVPVVAMHSAAAEIDAGLLLRGRTEAARVVEVRAETSGRVISKPLRKGAFVHEGDPLCELDPGTRHADLSEAEARLAEARINYNAATKLAEEGFASSTREASARAQLQSAEAAVERARREIERLTMRAPFEGYLESDTAELGLLLQPGSSCATVIQLDPIKMVGFVPEKEIDRVRPGAPAAARLVTGRELSGKVSFIARSADPETRTFRVEVTIPNPDLAVRDGQTAEIVIATEATRAHLLPSSALTLDDAGRLGVRVVDETSHARFVPLDIVRDTPEGVWVTGLPDKADVIIVGQEYVTDGAPVLPSFREATQ